MPCNCLAFVMLHCVIQVSPHRQHRDVPRNWYPDLQTGMRIRRVFVVPGRNIFRPL